MEGIEMKKTAISFLSSVLCVLVFMAGCSFAMSKYDNVTELILVMILGQRGFLLNSSKKNLMGLLKFKFLMETNLQAEICSKLLACYWMERSNLMFIQQVLSLRLITILWLVLYLGYSLIMR